jgi:Ca-activated chloride channel family protein
MPDLEQLHFLRPFWLIALPLAMGGGWCLLRTVRGRGGWFDVISPALRDHVLTGTPSTRRSRSWLAALGAICLIGLVLALAGPAWRQLPQPLFETDDALVIALDLSRSMDATDLAPNRLGRARLKTMDILSRRDGRQTALVVFSANAFVVTPLSEDSDTIAAMVASLTTDIMPSRGSFPAAAIRKGRDLLVQAGVDRGQLLLITDGGAFPETIRAAEEVASQGYRLSVLGVGTPEGSPIPRTGGGFLTDQAGNIVLSKLDEAALKRLARRGGGPYRRMTSDDSDLDMLLAPGSGAAGEATQASGQALTTDGGREEGPWLLLILLPMIALAFRRGVIVVLLCAVTLPGVDAVAADDDTGRSWWQTPDQLGAAALSRGEPEAAAALFDDPRWKAAAAYRAGDFERSAASLAGLGEVDDLYNLGNAAARAGQLQQAVEAYEGALTIDENHEDARHNLELVRDLLEEQSQQSDQSQQGQQGDQGQQGEQGQQDQSDGSSGEQSAQDQAMQNERGQGEESQGEEGQDSQGGNRSQQKPDNSDGADQAPGEQEQRDAQSEDEQDQNEASPSDIPDEAGAGQPQMANATEDSQDLEEEQAAQQWLRRIPDDPGGLLRNKFKRQYQRRGVDQDGNSLWPGDEAEPW